MSSRNVYLSAAERSQAVSLNQALKHAATAFQDGERSAGVLKQTIRSHITAHDRARIDYVEIVDDRTLEPVEHLAGPAIAAVAVHFGKTRLIDNILLR